MLSNEELRAKYDKFGKESAVPNEGFEDAGEYFAMIFGGEAFVSYIGELSLIKDLSKSAEINEEEEKEQEEKEQEEKERLEEEAKKKADETINKESHSSTESKKQKIDTETKSTAKESSSSKEPLRLLHHSDKTKQETTSATSDEPEEKKKSKLEEHEEEVRQKKEETVNTLAKKLIERLSVLTESSYDQACKDSFQAKFEIEANTLKMESFGLDILHTIGGIYVTKGEIFLNSQQFLGIPGFFSSVKAKGGIVMDTFRTVSSALDAQSTMQELQKLQELKNSTDVLKDEKTGEEIPKPTDEELAELEKIVMGKVLSAAWHGSKYEIQSTLREVCDKVLKDETETKKVRARRAESLILLGKVFLNAKRSKVEQEEAQIFEELVAEATKKKQHK